MPRLKVALRMPPPEMASPRRTFSSAAPQPRNWPASRSSCNSAANTSSKENGPVEGGSPDDRGPDSISACVFGDDIGGLLADHINGGHNEIAWDAGEDGGVDDAQSADSAHSKPAVENGHRIVAGSDFVGAGGVMAPGLVLDELAQFFGGIAALSGPQFAHYVAAKFAVHGADEVDALDHRIEVRAAVVSFREVAEFDVGGAGGVGGAERHAAGGVVGIGLEHSPGKPVAKMLELL